MNTLRLSVISFAAVGVCALSPMSAKATALGQTAHYAANQTAKPAAAPVDDSTLTDRIEKRFAADASLKKFDIDVSVKDHVATLTGKVRTETEKARAAREANVAGVTRVDNQLTLDKDAGKTVAEKVKGATNTAGNKTHSATDTAVDKTKSATNTAADKTKSATDTAVDKSKNAVSETGEVITDSWITTKVHAGFMGEDLLKGSDINVDTNNHVVTLKGTVKSDAGRARAVQIAKTTKGVTKVVDDLKISSN
jgi:hyperosmotically inducible protein